MMVLLAVVGSILLVGVVLLAAWKLVITIHDRREFARFQNARSRARYEMVRIILFWCSSTSTNLFSLQPKMSSKNIVKCNKTPQIMATKMTIELNQWLSCINHEENRRDMTCNKGPWPGMLQYAFSATRSPCCPDILF